MKPSSIIVLIIAALLVISGTVVCLIGNSTAQSDGRELFTQVIDGKPYEKREFSANEISTIELSVENATVNVTGGSINSYIEFINYNPGSYDLDVSSQTITFEKSEFSILNGFGFKGYRNLIDSNVKGSGSDEKVINIHLSEGSLISAIKIRSEKIKVNIENVQIKKDLKIFSSSSADVVITDFAAGGDLSISSPDVRINSEKLGSGNFIVDKASSARIDMTDSDVRGISINTDSGSVVIENCDRGKEAEFDLRTEAGNLTVDGEKIESGTYTEKPKEAKYVYKIKTASAHINYKNKSDQLPADETGETDDNG